MTPSLASLLAIPGVQGLLFHRGLEVVESHLPQLWDPKSARVLSEAVIHAFTGYASAGRQATQCWFEYPEASILALTPPLQENQITRTIAREPGSAQQIATPFLTFVISDRSCLEALLPPANAFLARQAAIQMDLWLRCRDELLRTLAKAVDLPTAKKLLREVITTERLPPDASVASADFGWLGQKVIDLVPNEAVQPELRAEFSRVLNTMQDHKAAIRTRAV